MITDKQRLDRQKGIGSSDVPTILGLNPWSTAYDLWLRKTDQIPQVVENEAMEIGSALELPILKIASKRLKVKIVRPSSVFVANKIMRANIDGMFLVAQRGSPIVEVKTTGMSSLWGDEGSSDVPETVKAQVMYQMLCSDSRVAHIACLFADRGLRLKIYTVHYDQEYANHIIDRVNSFWSNCVSKTPPEATATLDCLRQIKRTESEVSIEQSLFEEDERLQAIAKQAESDAETARSRLVVALGSASRGVGGEYRITVSSVETRRLDSKSLRSQRPEIYSQYEASSTYAKIIVKKNERK